MSSQRVPIIAANWKMNTTLSEAGQLVQSMIPDLVQVPSVDRVVCPPFISIATVAEYLLGTGIRVGAQNCYFEPKGAFTGEISAPMLKGLADYVIIGHSERRQYFHETDDVICTKVKSVFDAGLLPILCVGERLDENEADQTRVVIERQLRGALAGLDTEKIASLVVAYEPVWAIGTGRAATPGQANDVIGSIRSMLAEILDKAIASQIRIQYGGSVTADNFESIISQPEIDGALVGGASLNAAAFGAIVRLAAS